MLVTRHGMNPKINWGRGAAGCDESRMDLKIFGRAKLPPKSLNLWGVIKQDEVPINALKRGERRRQALRWKLDTIAQISLLLTRTFIAMRCSMWTPLIFSTHFVAHYYFTLRTAVFPPGLLILMSSV